MNIAEDEMLCCSYTPTMPTLLRPATDTDLPTLYEQQFDHEATAAFPSQRRTQIFGKML